MIQSFRPIFALLFLIGTSTAANALEIQEMESAKGIKAWLVEDHTLPIISISFSFDGGSVQDPQGKEGASRLMTSLLDEGAGEMEAEDFQNRMEDLAMGVSFSAGRDYYFGSARLLRPNLEPSLELIRLALLEPRFDEQPFERIRDQILSGIRASENSPSRLAGEAMRALVYPENHVYRRDQGGTLESVSRLKIEDLKEIKARVFARDTLKVAIVGAISQQEASEMLDYLFASLPETADLTQSEFVEPKVGGSEAIELSLPQVQMSFVGAGMDREDPDYLAAYLVNHILGGAGLSSRLSLEIREERGLAYSVSTGLSNNEYSNLFSGQVATRVEFAEETFQVLMDELKRMGEEGPTEEELDLAKSYVTGVYALNFDGSRSTASALLGLQLQDRTPQYIEDRRDLIANVTLEDARRAAARLFKDNKFAVVQVGPKTL